MYGLKSITLHNSYYTGLATRIELGGHTNCSGTNAAGKTTMLNLVPLFYGAKPSLMNPVSKDKLPYWEFVLPRQSSLLIFEYAREDGPRCSVMYRTGSSDYAYRFINASYENSFGIEEAVALLNDGHPATHVLNHLQASGVDMSRQYTTPGDYARVLQNDIARRGRSGHSGSQGLLRDAQTYCLGGPGASMRDMGLLTHTLVRREKMYERLKHMVLSTMIHYQPPQIPRNRGNEKLLSDLRSLRDFMSEQDRLRDCIRQHKERIDVQSAILRHVRGVAEGLEQLQKSMAETRSAQIAKSQALEDAEESYRLTMEAISEKLNAARFEAKTLNEQIEAAEEDDAQWRERNISSKEEAVLQIESLREIAEEARRHLESLEREQSELQSELERRLIEIEGQLQRRRSTLSGRIQELRQARSEVAESTANQVTAINEQRRLSESVAHREYGHRKDPLQSRLGAVEADISGMGLTEEERTEQAIADEQLRQCQDQLTQLSHEAEEARAEIAEKTRKFQVVEAEFARQERRVNEASNRVSELTALCFPEDGSLLAALRKNAPDWADSIGRVIDPALLSRKDLDPEFGLDGDGLYGVGINLEKIRKGQHGAPPDMLLEARSAAELKAKAEGQARDDLAQQMKKVVGEKAAIAERIEALERAIKMEREALETARLHRDDLIDSHKARLADRRADLKKEREVLKNQISGLLKQHERRLKEIADEEESRRRQVNDERLLKISDLDRKIEDVEAEIEGAQIRARQQSAEAEEAFNAKCESRDVDTAALASARQRSNATRARVTEVEGYQNEINEYRLWHRQVWRKYKGNCERLREVTEVASKLESEHGEQRNRHENERAHLRRELEGLKAKLGKQETLEKRAKDALFQAGAATPEGSVESGELSYLVDRLGELLEGEYRLRGQILKGVSKASLTLQKHADSAIGSAWDELRQSRLRNSPYDEGDEEFRLQQPEDLAVLLDVQVPQIRAAQLETVRSVGNTFIGFFHDISSIDTEVRRVSEELREKINTNQRIASLSDIELGLKSKIQTAVDNWDELKGFVSAFQEWDLLMNNDLPPPELEQSMARVIAMMQAGRVRTEIGDLVDLTISMTESGRRTEIHNNASFADASSNGLSYLALIVIFIGLSRYLCPDRSVTLTWPIDELGTLETGNISRLFDMLDRNNIQMLAAFPNLDPMLLQYFESRYILDRDRGASELQHASLEGQPEERVSEVLSALGEEEAVH